MFAEFPCPFCFGAIAGASLIMILWASCQWQIEREMRRGPRERQR